MDALQNDLRRELIKRVFPELRYGGDPDIDKYFDCRRSGRMGEALGIYNGPLRMRYPEDGSRILLLKLYREGDPRWLELQDKLILQLAERIARSVERNIDVLVAPLGRAELSNAFRALSAVESLLRIIPAQGDDAQAFLERYESLARLLQYRAAEMERAVGLVREYLAMARSDSPAEYDFIARSQAIEEKRREAAARERARRGQVQGREERYDFVAGSEALEEQKKKEARERARYFDLSRIQFSAVDRGRIEILPSIVRKEDKVLAFCWKYWETVYDPGFERLIFLYSKKYGTRHYAIYRSIKVGRVRHFTDDEILTAVSTLLSTSYSYSVSGDLYMQATWRRLRARAEAERAAAAQESIAAPKAALPEPKPLAPPMAKQAPAAKLSPRLSAKEKAPARAPSKPIAAKVPASIRQASSPVAISSAPQKPKAAPAARADQAAQLTPKAARAGSITPVDANAKKRGKDLISRPKAPMPVQELSARSGSVSDRIRRLSGKAYDVYKEIFFERVREDIHRCLLANRTRAFRLFDDSANAAEELIFGFMTAHYADPFMNWEDSEERKKVEALGYRLPSLDPIIEAWFRRL
jgi:hypothetical protein